MEGTLESSETNEEPSWKEFVIKEHSELILQAARDAEANLTALMQDVAQSYGGTMAGLSERLKTAQSLNLKIGRDLQVANLQLLEAMSRARDMHHVTIFSQSNRFAFYTSSFIL